MDRSIQQAIQILSGTHLADKVYAVDASVLSVDESTRTASVQIISGKATNTITVKLMSAVDDGLLIVPAVGSTVNVILSDFTLPYVTQYSEVDKIVLRGGDLGGLIKILQLTEKLNKLVLQVTQELPKIAAGIATGGGSYTPGTLDQFNKNDYENKVITHG